MVIIGEQIYFGTAIIVYGKRDRLLI